jgi:peptide deformylase
MALLNILKYPDPRLRIKAQPAEQITDELRQMIDDMFETMYESQGVGLAATQANIHKRFFTMDVSEKQNERICILNPEIISREGIQYESEACLSVGGGAFDKVERALNVQLRYMNLEGKTVELSATGLMAACIQHEMDHLDGVLFIDHLSRLKQDRIRKKIEKDQRYEQE